MTGQLEMIIRDVGIKSAFDLGKTKAAFYARPLNIDEKIMNFRNTSTSI